MNYIHLVTYLEKTCGSIGFDDVTVYDWINEDLLRKTGHLDTINPIQVGFYVSGKKTPEYRVFIGTEDDDNNITVTKKEWIEVFDSFLKELNNSSVHINLEGDDIGYTFNNTNELIYFLNHQ